MEVKEKILKIALELFNQKGTEQISTNEIASKAEISPGTLYYHFRNKEEIIREIFINMAGEYEEKYYKKISFEEIKVDNIFFDDEVFFEMYSFFSKEANILIKNDLEFKKIYLEFRNRHIQEIKQVLIKLQVEEILEKEINAKVIDKIAEIISFNSLYNPLVEELDIIKNKDNYKDKKKMAILGFLTEKGKIIFD